MNRPYHTRLVLLGVALYIMIAAVILGVALVLEPSEWEYPLIVAGIVLAFAVPVFFWHPWGLAVGGIGGIVSLMFAADGLSENLSSPDSFMDFAYRLVFCGAATILILWGSVGGLVQHFRSRTGQPAPAVVPKLVFGLLVVVASLSFASVVLTFMNRDTVSAADREGAVTLRARFWKFDTARLAIPREGTTKILVRNRDAVVHTFTVPALGIDVKVGPRGEKLAVFDSPAPGTYEFVCTITGHDSMVGALVVE